MSALLKRVRSVRRLLIESADQSLIGREDIDRFNALLAIAIRERPREPLLISFPPIYRDQRVDRSDLVARYDRLGLAFGEGASAESAPPQGVTSR